MMPQAEFQSWLSANHKHLLNYRPHEVALLAIACGFDVRQVTPRISGWITKSKRLLQFWESPLGEQWLRLTLYESGHDE